jgi:hypothetical protein
VIGALAAGGAAFTASNPISSENTAGYGSVAVTGATVTDVHHTLSADGQSITQVDLSFAAATPVPSNAQVQIGFGPTAGTAPADVNIPCTLASGGLSATCGDGTGILAPTTSQSFAVAVNH